MGFCDRKSLGEINDDIDEVIMDTIDTIDTIDTKNDLYKIYDEYDVIFANTVDEYNQSMIFNHILGWLYAITALSFGYIAVTIDDMMIVYLYLVLFLFSVFMTIIHVSGYFRAKKMISIMQSSGEFKNNIKHIS